MRWKVDTDCEEIETRVDIQIEISNQMQKYTQKFRGYYHFKLIYKEFEFKNNAPTFPRTEVPFMVVLEIGEKYQFESGLPSADTASMEF